MPRYWLSFRGPFGTRPGFSVSHRELFRKRPPAVSAAGMLGIFRRTDDGRIFLGIVGKNGAAENMPGSSPSARFALPPRKPLVDQI
jgi:hypothetical protein